MAKKRKQAQAQILLSPENYIRQKARNLPIYKCWINADWSDCRLAHIFIARQHANDNVTFCVYLVDLGCLGVKDTSYRFNISLEELEGMIMKIGEDIEIDDTLSYSLAHNIIYSAIEFAEEYGFKPHRDFTQITQFFLEEDTDEIPLIAVECGHIEEDGKPFYINTGYESPAKTKQIIAQLNKTAGEGNYHIFIDVAGYDNDDNEFDDEYDDDEFDEYDDEYDEVGGAAADALLDEVRQLSKKEQETLFFELLHRENEEVTQEGVRKLIMLTHLLANDYTDEEAAEKYRKELAPDVDYPTAEYYKKFVNLDNISDNPADTLARNAAFEKYLASFENENESLDNVNPFIFTTKLSALSRILEQKK